MPSSALTPLRRARGYVPSDDPDEALRDRVVHGISDYVTRCGRFAVIRWRDVDPVPDWQIIADPDQPSAVVRAWEEWLRGYGYLTSSTRRGSLELLEAALEGEGLLHRPTPA